MSRGRQSAAVEGVVGTRVSPAECGIELVVRGETTRCCATSEACQMRPVRSRYWMGGCARASDEEAGILSRVWQTVRLGPKVGDLSTLREPQDLRIKSPLLYHWTLSDPESDVSTCRRTRQAMRGAPVVACHEPYHLRPFEPASSKPAIEPTTARLRIGCWCPLGVRWVSVGAGNNRHRLGRNRGGSRCLPSEIPISCRTSPPSAHAK
jgi:hypothetical protein